MWIFLTKNTQKLLQDVTDMHPDIFNKKKERQDFLYVVKNQRNSCIAFIIHYKKMNKTFEFILIGNQFRDILKPLRRIRCFKSRDLQDKVATVLTHESIHMVIDRYIDSKIGREFDYIDRKCNISEPI